MRIFAGLRRLILIGWSCPGLAIRPWRTAMSVVGMTAANGVYTSSFHSLKGSYQELLLQKEKPKKRASAGGSVAGGGAAASGLVFEYCDLLFKAFREQRSCFKVQRKEGGAALSRESHQHWCRH